MAIPQGRLSTTIVPGVLLEPENIQELPLVSHERGPIAIEDTSQGLLNQNWTLTYNAGTGDMTATPETTGSPVIVLTVLGLTFFSFTFDQNARIVIAYSTLVSSYLYWFDTALGMTTTKDLGSIVITPFISLDDKRETQSALNDMLLWYLKPDGLTYELFMLLQRERFLTEYSMITGVVNPKLQKVGMTDELRIQIETSV